MTYILMEVRKTALERAFELARTGKCFNVGEIIIQLKSERLNAEQVEGAALKKQLMQIIDSKNKERS